MSDPRRTRPEAPGLRLVSRLVPPDEREEWTREWAAEWAAARATGRSGPGLWLGMVADARAVRQRASGSPASTSAPARSGRDAWASLRRSVRSLVRAPAFSVPAVFTLALGLGSTAAVTTVVDAVLLRPLPYPAAERVMRVSHLLEGDAGYPLARFTYRYLEDEARSFEAFGGYWDPTLVTLAGDGEAERVRGVEATVGLMEVLGARPVLGRLFNEDDGRLGEQSGVVISHRLWTRRLGADAEAVGGTVVVDGVGREVLGVMAPDVDLPRTQIDLWLPYIVPAGVPLDDSFRIYALGRLRAGVDADAASRELDVLTNRLPEFAGFYDILLDDFGLSTVLRPVRDEVLGAVTRPLWVVLGAVSIVLLVALANVATLFLVRSERKAFETSTRRALGATRGNLMFGFLSESFWIAAAGGALGLALAGATLRVFVSLAPPTIPRLDQIALSPVTVAVVLALAAAASLALGLYPFLRFGRGAATLRVSRTVGEGRRRAAVGSGFVVAQVALALPLLAGAALLLQTFRLMTDVDPGFDPEGIVVAQFSLPAPFYPDSESVDRFRARLTDLLEGRPAVAGAAFGPSPLVSRGCNGLHIEGRVLADDEFPPCVPVAFVGPGYFELIGNPLLAGRTIRSSDLEGPAAAVVTANVARRLWPDGDPLQESVHPAPRPGPPWFPVVGVVSPVHGEGPDQPETEILYLPLGAMDPDGWLDRTVDLLIATAPGQEEAAVEILRSAVGEIDPGVPVTVRGTLTEGLERTMTRSTFTLFLLGSAALTALCLGLVGLYAVVSYRLESRRPEIGLRMAVGARSSQIRSLVVGHTLRLALIGVTLGLVGAALLTRTLTSLLYGVAPGDPWVLGLSAGVLVVTAVLASWLPSVRATRIDPATVLRTD